MKKADIYVAGLDQLAALTFLPAQSVSSTKGTAANQI